MRCFSRLPCNNQNTTRLCRIYEISLCFYDCLFLSLIKPMRGEGQDMPYILEGSGDTIFVAEYMKNMCPCPCFSLLLFGMKFITGFGCHQSEKEISSIVFSRPFRFVSFRFLWSPTSAQPSFMSSSSNSWYCWWFFSFLSSSSACVLCLISLFRVFAFFHVPKQWWLLLEVVVYVDLPHRSEG